MKKQLPASPMLFPMPALLVGTYGEDGAPDAMTAAWAGACCHVPPCVGVAIRHNRLTFRNIDLKKAFTLNVPPTRLAAEVDYLGIVSGNDQPDKLARAGLEVSPGTKVDAPLVMGCPINLECRLVQKIVLGSHAWFVGEVVAVNVDEELVDAKGKIDVAALDPLVYCTSVTDYRSLGGRVAGAYDVGNTLKKP
jgi:flavin reductase (DIM6/NTAB) family NADH-FMN oxidoreductase RutF